MSRSRYSGPEPWGVSSAVYNPYPPRRVGCARCDWVGATRVAVDESEIHQVDCPNCGQRTLHRYPIVGSWPSDYGDRPPCASDQEADA